MFINFCFIHLKGDYTSLSPTTLSSISELSLKSINIIQPCGLDKTEMNFCDINEVHNDPCYVNSIGRSNETGHLEFRNYFIFNNNYVSTSCILISLFPAS